MSGGQPIHICYYSNKCKWSKAFITELANTPWKQQFRFICADPSPTRPQLPSWLKKVPTIVLAGEPEPRTDSDVMNWLYEKKMKEGAASKSQSGHQNSATPGAPDEPNAWSTAEQMSFSKGFSYSSLDTDTSTQGDGGNTMPGAFAFLNGGAAGNSDPSHANFLGSPAPDSKKAKSRKEEMFDKQMQAYQEEREAGMPRMQSRS